jgi:hypothetical protein
MERTERARLDRKPVRLTLRELRGKLRVTQEADVVESSRGGALADQMGCGRVVPTALATGDRYAPIVRGGLGTAAPVG